MEMASTYEVGESSADPRVTSSVLRNELSGLREDMTWCQGRYMSKARSTYYQPSTVVELIKEKREGKKVAGKLQFGLYRQSARMSPVEETYAEFQGRLDSLDKRMIEVGRIARQLSQTELYAGDDSRHYRTSIRELWSELHEMQRQTYAERMVRFSSYDSIDVMAVYGDRSGDQ